MWAYIARRLLLMIPTLIGLTFLVFMLIALSPGGIGASLGAAGGQMDTSSRAQQQAYLEDRYGLDSPVIVQYLRWLSRVSPVRFGARDQRTAEGSLERPPKHLKPPVVWGWVADELPEVPPTEPIVWPTIDQLELEEGEDPASALAEERVRIYRRARSNYLRERGRFVAARTGYEQAIIAYSRDIGLDAITADRKLKKSALAGHTPVRTTDTWAAVERAGAQAIEAYEIALVRQGTLQAAFDAKPFSEAGLPIIPGVVSLATPDLGKSFSKSQPVGSLIADRLPVTILLNLIAFPIIYAIAIPGGMIAATRQGTWIDVGSGMILVGLWSVPVVWAGVLMIGYLASNQYLGWFPVNGLHDANADDFMFMPSVENGVWHRGYLLDTLWHLVLPVTCLVYAGFAVLAKQTRAAMLDNFNADYIRTAKAKGVSSRDVVFRHVFRNSLLPLITMFATIFPAMLAGSVVVEQIFSINGMGSLIIEAIYLRDREVILANALMIGAVNMLGLLMADILYAVVDPRITYS